MSDQKIIFSGCGHELERVIADMSCPVCARKEIERLQAELSERDKQIESLQNKWASRELSQHDSDALMAENTRLREALEKIASCEKRAEGDVVDIAQNALKD